MRLVDKKETYVYSQEDINNGKMKEHEEEMHKKNYYTSDQRNIENDCYITYQKVC